MNKMNLLSKSLDGVSARMIKPVIFAANDTNFAGDRSFLPQRLTSLSVFLPSVSFTDCGGAEVQFQVDQPSDFRVSEAGAISTSRHFSLAAQGKVAVVVYALDQRSGQVWKTKVHLHAAPLQVTQLDKLHNVRKGCRNVHHLTLD